MIVSALPSRWRARATELERFSPAAAEAFRDAAAQLSEALEASEEAVTLAEASEIGGYSVDSLQRMVAAGRIENTGRKGKPRIRLAQVPTKPGCALHLRRPVHASRVYPTAVVASVIAREKAP
jgi:hypothetical protein